MTKGVNLDSRMGCAEVIKQLHRMGELKLDDSQSFQKNGVRYFHIREMGFFESLKEKIFVDEVARKQRASRVADALKTVLEKSGQSQLLENIHQRIAHKSGFTGKDLSRDFAPVSAHKNIRPLMGGRVAARNMGASIRLLGASAESVRADKAILRASTGGKLITQDWLSGKADPYTHEPVGYADWKSGLAKAGNILSDGFPKVFQMSLEHAAASKVAFIWEADTHRAHSPEKLYAWLSEAIGDASGSVVIEPQPDQYSPDKKQGVKPVYTDEGLKTQVRVAMDKVAQAKEKGRNLVITFATPDPALQEALKRARMSLGDTD